MRVHDCTALHLSAPPNEATRFQLYTGTREVDASQEPTTSLPGLGRLRPPPIIPAATRSAQFRARCITAITFFFPPASLFATYRLYVVYALKTNQEIQEGERVKV
jgi:hypothetical protein